MCVCVPQEAETGDSSFKAGNLVTVTDGIPLVFKCYWSDVMEHLINQLFWSGYSSCLCVESLNVQYVCCGEPECLVCVWRA